MNRIRIQRKNISDIVACAMYVCSIALLASALLLANASGDTDVAAEKVERRVSQRMEILDRFMEQALSSDNGSWMQLDGLPSDMVIYRYVNDTLKAWANTFTISNDDISSKLLFKRLSNPKNPVSSPLSDITDSTSFLNIGQAWYLTKSISFAETKVIAGLCIVNELDNSSSNKVNPKLHLRDNFSIAPLSESGGSPVLSQGSPLFKILMDTGTGSVASDQYLIWLSLFVFIIASLCMLASKPCPARLRTAMLLINAAMAGMYIWGHSLQGESYIFSPTLYAHGAVLFSLGAVLIINLFILSNVLAFFLSRKIFYWKFRFWNKTRIGLVSSLVILIILAISYYTHRSFRSIVLNSSINLELYKLNELTKYSALVYLSYITMLFSLPLSLMITVPAARRLFNCRPNFLSPLFRVAFSIAVGVYLVSAPAVLGFKKEKSAVEVWANRLSVDRDITLEMQLRMVENGIADDYFISSLSVLQNAGSIILNRIVDNFMFTISQDYDISAVLLEDENFDPILRSYFNDIIHKGVKIHENSRFLYSPTSSGKTRYAGVFTYFDRIYGVHYLIVEVQPKSGRDYGGYSSLLGISAPGHVIIPARYSYAKYTADKLQSYKGNFGYPTLLTRDFIETLTDAGNATFLSDGHRHFINEVADDEIVIISRKKESISSYAVSALFLALIEFILMSLLSLTRVRRQLFQTTYFKNRITSVLMISLILTLVSMVVVSTYFVYERNAKNMEEVMSEKIRSIQTMLFNTFRYCDDYHSLNPQELSGAIENASEIARADITLYSVQGMAFRSTASDIFDRMIISFRMNNEAFNNIVYRHRGYFINKEKANGLRYNALYAPIFNDNGDMVAIVSSPYTDENYDFERDAITHSATILTLFIILLFAASLITSSILDRMLAPIVKIGKRMHATYIDNLQYIDYQQNDEISTLVNAYNMMVHDLSESTKQLTQAERDKAWSSMARQVAHEIKNPLTPMKLQMQRLIRLKQRNIPGWEDKFDEVAKVVLDHIDILTDTANEFSTFAKLYSEEPSEINLDQLLQEEISMFDNRDDISFRYMGIPGVSVMGPKPQLTRVFVNLITNSIQAIDIQHQETAEAGGDAGQGRIYIALRNSNKDGYYDIVFEDNGPGVSVDNQDKLFTPNFTTKNGGTGLGLAICRSILEKCNAEITYSRSFELQGACFTIRYPVNRS